MSDPGPTPVLVYDRIAANRRNTLLLLVVFVFIFVLVGAALVALLQVLGGERLLGMFPWLDDRFQSGDWGPQEDMELAARLLGVVAGVTMLIALPITLLVYFYSASLVHSLTGARPVTRDQEIDLWRSVENLCIGAGLPLPRLAVVETAVPNAFATGRDPSRAVLTVTRGLLDLLDRRGLQAVIAHELSHIGNYDTRLSGTVTGLRFTLRLVCLVLVGSFWMGCLCGSGILLVINCPLMVVMSTVAAFYMGILAVVALFVDPFGGADAGFPWYVRWYERAFAVLYLGGPLVILLLGPRCASFICRAIYRQREFLADADAVLLTRDPEGLALALATIDGARATGRMRASGLTGHMCIVDPRAPEGGCWRWLWPRLSPPHPPIEARIARLAELGEAFPASLDAAWKKGRAHSSGPPDDSRARRQRPRHGRKRSRFRE